MAAAPNVGNRLRTPENKGKTMPTTGPGDHF